MHLLPCTTSPSITSREYKKARKNTLHLKENHTLKQLSYSPHRRDSEISHA